MGETRKPIVIVGSITMDLVTRTPRIPAIGQTLIGTEALNPRLAARARIKPSRQRGSAIP